MPLLNYTTKVNSQKTVTEVMALLVAKGAYQVDSASERIKLGPRCQHLIPWQPNQVTFMLNTWPDIYPEQRHHSGMFCRRP